MASLVFIALAAVAIVGHTVLLPFRGGSGGVVPLVEPSAWEWLPWYLAGEFATDVLFWGILYRIGR